MKFTIPSLRNKMVLAATLYVYSRSAIPCIMNYSAVATMASSQGINERQTILF